MRNGTLTNTVRKSEGHPGRSEAEIQDRIAHVKISESIINQIFYLW